MLPISHGRVTGKGNPSCACSHCLGKLRGYLQGLWNDPPDCRNRGTPCCTNKGHFLTGDHRVVSGYLYDGRRVWEMINYTNGFYFHLNMLL